MNIAPTKAFAPTPEEIAVRAYHIWEQEGRPSGHEQEHWLKAQQQLSAMHKQEDHALRGWEKSRGLSVTKKRRF